MANPIRKLVQLVFDRSSGRRTEEEAKQSLSRVDRALGALKATAIAVGGALAAALAVRKIVDFGRASVRAAAESQAIWNRLAGTLDGVGVNFDTVEVEVRSLARAMQDASVVGDEDFATVLQILVDISQDFEGSLRNVATVADVAAAKQIDLRTAAQLVGRAMIGETSLLRRYGIIVQEGTDAVEAMRRQFHGMSENEAKTFQGRMTQLTNEWGDFKEAVGEALIEAGNGVSVLDTVIASVKALTIWVEDNAVQLQNMADGMIRVVEAGGRFIQWGMDRIDPAGAFARIHREQIRALENDEQMLEKRRELAQHILELQRDLDAPSSDATTLMGIPGEERDPKDVRGIEAEINATQRLIEHIDDLMEARAAVAAAPRRPPRTPESDEDSDAAKEAKRLATEAARIAEAVRTPMEVYQDTLANLRTHLEAGRISQVTYARAAEDAAEAYAKATEKLDPIASILEQHDEQMMASATIAELLGSGYSALQQEASILTATMQALADQGIGPNDEAMLGFAERLREVRGEMQIVEREAELLASIASATGEIVGAAFGGDLGRLASAKARQNAILAAEHTAHGIAAAASLFGAVNAGAHFTAAAKYAAIAAAWGGFSAAIGGGGSGGGGARGASAGRDAGGPRSERMSPPGPEVHIYFEGAGFDAVNPEVQRVVAGAQQLVSERYGPNATVRTHRRGGRG